MSDQYQVLAPFINERILSLVKYRLFNGGRFFDKNTLREKYNRSDIKLVLLLVAIANPKEPLSVAEKTLLSGAMRQQEESALDSEISAPDSEISALSKITKKPR